jgi:hypothetical protein
VAVAPGQSRQEVLQLRQLHLSSGLPRARVQGEDVEDETRPIEHAHAIAPGLFQVPGLASRELLVEDHKPRAIAAHRFSDLGHGPLTDERGGIRSGAFLDEPLDDLPARRVHESFELVQMIFRDGARNAAGSHADQDDALALCGSCHTGILARIGPNRTRGSRPPASAR